MIFDECTSGFREAFVTHMNFDIYPDICVLGKAIDNGYAITAVLGKRDVIVQHASFISILD